MAFVPQRVERPGLESARFVEDAVRQPLVVKARAADGGGHVHAVVDHVRHHLQHGGDDGAATWGAGHQNRLAVLEHQRRRHRAQHALAGRDGVGFAPDEAKGVRGTRFGGEVVHLVVEQKAGAGHDDLRAVAEVQRGGVGHGVAGGVQHRDVRGLRALRRPARAGADLVGAGRFGGVEVRQPRAGVLLVREHRHRHVEEVRIAQMLGAVRVGAAFGFDQEMRRGGRADAQRLHVVRLQHVEQLHQQHAAGRWRRHGNDLEAPVGAAHGVAPLGPVSLQVLVANEAVAALHLGDEQIRRSAGVEAVAALVAHALQRRRQVRLPEHVAGGVGAAVGLGELGLAGGVAFEPLPVPGELARQVLGERETVLRQPDRRRERLLPRQRAVPRQHREQAVHRARHADRQVRGRGAPGHHVAVRVQVHVAAGPSGRDFAVIVHGDAPVGQAQHHEAAAAEVAGGGMRHRQGEAHGNRRVHGVAAAFQDVQADLGGQRRARRHHAAFAHHGFGDGRWFHGGAGGGDEQRRRANAEPRGAKPHCPLLNFCALLLCAARRAGESSRRY